MQDKLVIGIRGTSTPPWMERVEECFDTWAGVFQDRGYTVKALYGNPELETEYKEEGDILWSKGRDDYPGDIFLKTVFIPCKWFLSTDLEYFYIVDNDTFVHPDRFIGAFEEVLGKYGEDLNYWGGCTPWREWAFNTNYQEWITPGHCFHHFCCIKNNYQEFRDHMAQGGSGFVLSRKAAQAILDNYNSANFPDWEEGGVNGSPKGHGYHDDMVVGRTLIIFSGINLLHDSRFLHVSPLQNNIAVGDWSQSPFIGEGYGNGDQLVAQHYVGEKYDDERFHMKNLMEYLGLKRSLEGQVKSLAKQDITDQELGNKIRHLIWNKN